MSKTPSEITELGLQDPIKTLEALSAIEQEFSDKTVSSAFELFPVLDAAMKNAKRDDIRGGKDTKPLMHATLLQQEIEAQVFNKETIDDIDRLQTHKQSIIVRLKGKSTAENAKTLNDLNVEETKVSGEIQTLESQHKELLENIVQYEQHISEEESAEKSRKKDRAAQMEQLSEKKLEYEKELAKIEHKINEESLSYRKETEAQINREHENNKKKIEEGIENEIEQNTNQFNADQKKGKDSVDTEAKNLQEKIQKITYELESTGGIDDSEARETNRKKIKQKMKEKMEAEKKHLISINTEIANNKPVFGEMYDNVLAVSLRILTSKNLVSGKELKDLFAFIGLDTEDTDFFQKILEQTFAEKLKRTGLKFNDTFEKLLNKKGVVPEEARFKALAGIKHKPLEKVTRISEVTLNTWKKLKEDREESMKAKEEFESSYKGFTVDDSTYYKSRVKLLEAYKTDLKNLKDDYDAKKASERQAYGSKISELNRKKTEMLEKNDLEKNRKLDNITMSPTAKELISQKIQMLTELQGTVNELEALVKADVPNVKLELAKNALSGLEEQQEKVEKEISTKRIVQSNLLAKVQEAQEELKLAHDKLEEREKIVDELREVSGKLEKLRNISKISAAQLLSIYKAIAEKAAENAGKTGKTDGNRGEYENLESLLRDAISKKNQELLANDKIKEAVLARIKTVTLEAVPTKTAPPDAKDEADLNRIRILSSMAELVRVAKDTGRQFLQMKQKPANTEPAIGSENEETRYKPEDKVEKEIDRIGEEYKAKDEARRKQDEIAQKEKELEIARQAAEESKRTQEQQRAHGAKLRSLDRSIEESEAKQLREELEGVVGLDLAALHKFILSRSKNQGYDGLRILVKSLVSNAMKMVDQSSAGRAQIIEKFQKNLFEILAFEYTKTFSKFNNLDLLQAQLRNMLIDFNQEDKDYFSIKAFLDKALLNIQKQEHLTPRDKNVLQLARDNVLIEIVQNEIEVLSKNQEHRQSVSDLEDENQLLKYDRLKCEYNIDPSILNKSKIITFVLENKYPSPVVETLKALGDLNEYYQYLLFQGCIAHSFSPKDVYGQLREAVSSFHDPRNKASSEFLESELEKAKKAFDKDYALFRKADEIVKDKNNDAARKLVKQAMDSKKFDSVENLKLDIRSLFTKIETLLGSDDTWKTQHSKVQAKIESAEAWLTGNYVEKVKELMTEVSENLARERQRIANEERKAQQEYSTTHGVLPQGTSYSTTMEESLVASLAKLEAAMLDLDPANQAKLYEALKTMGSYPADVLDLISKAKGYKDTNLRYLTRMSEYLQEMERMQQVLLEQQKKIEQAQQERQPKEREEEPQSRLDEMQQELTERLSVLKQNELQLEKERRKLEESLSAANAEERRLARKEDDLIQKASELTVQGTTLEKDRGNLNADRKSLEDVKNTLEEQATTLENRENKLSSEVAALQGKIQDLEQNNAHLRGQLAEMNARREKEPSKKPQLFRTFGIGVRPNIDQITLAEQLDLENKEKEIADLKRNLKAKEEELRRLQEMLRVSEEANRRTAEYLDQSRKSAASYLSQAAGQRDISASLLKRLTSAGEDRDKLKKLVGDLEEDLRKNRKELELARKEYDQMLDEMQKKNAALEALLAKIQDELKGKAEELSEKGKKIEILEQEKSQALQEKESENKTKEEALNELAAEQAKAQAVQEELRDARDALEKSEQVRQAAEQERAASAAQIAQQKEAISSLREDLKGTQEELTQAKQASAESAADLKKQAETISSLQADLRSSHGALAQAEKAKNADADEVARQMSEIAGLKEKLQNATAALHGSEQKQQEEHRRAEEADKGMLAQKQTILELQAELQAAKQESKSIQEKLGNAEQGSSELQKELAKERQRTIEFQAELKSVHAALRTAEEQIRSAELEKAKLQRALEGAQSDAARLKSELDSMRKAFDETQEKLRGAQTEASAAKKRADDLEREGEKYKDSPDKIRGLQEELNASRARNSSLTRENAALLSQQTVLQGKSEEATATLEKERQAFKAALAAAKASATKAEELQRKAEQDLDQQKGKVRDLEKALDSTGERIRSLDQELKASQAEAKSKDEQLQAAKGKIEGVGKERERSLQEKEQLKKQIATLQEKLSLTQESAKKEIASLKEQLSQLEEERRKEIGSLQGKVSQTEEAARKEIDLLRAKLVQLEADKKKLSQTEGETKKEIDLLKGKLSQLEASAGKEIASLKEKLAQLEAAKAKDIALLQGKLSELEKTKEQERREKELAIAELSRRIAEAQQKLQVAEKQLEAAKQAVPAAKVSSMPLPKGEAEPKGEPKPEGKGDKDKDKGIAPPSDESPPKPSSTAKPTIPPAAPRMVVSASPEPKPLPEQEPRAMPRARVSGTMTAAFDHFLRRAEKVGRKDFKKVQVPELLTAEGFKNLYDKMHKSIKKKSQMSSIDESKLKQEFSHYYEESRKKGKEPKYNFDAWKKNRETKTVVFSGAGVTFPEDVTKEYFIQVNEPRPDQPRSMPLQSAYVKQLVDKQQIELGVIISNPKPGDIPAENAYKQTLILMLENAREITRRTGNLKIEFDQCEGCPDKAYLIELYATKMGFKPIVFDKASQQALDAYKAMHREQLEKERKSFELPAELAQEASLEDELIFEPKPKGSPKRDT